MPSLLLHEDYILAKNGSIITGVVIILLFIPQIRLQTRRRSCQSLCLYLDNPNLVTGNTVLLAVNPPVKLTSQSFQAQIQLGSIPDLVPQMCPWPIESTQSKYTSYCSCATCVTAKAPSKLLCKSRFENAPQLLLYPKASSRVSGIRKAVTSWGRHHGTISS